MKVLSKLHKDSVKKKFFPPKRLEPPMDLTKNITKTLNGST